MARGCPNQKLRRICVRFLALAVLCGSGMGAAAFAADAVGQVYDGQVSSIEREVLALVQAMPADKFDFAPTNGTFTGVRTFALQARHDATMIWRVSASVLGEKNPPVDTGPGDNGPANLTTKDAIVDYFKGAVAYAHKSMSSITRRTCWTRCRRLSDAGTTTRLAAAAFLGLHSYDHYGQMVVYARMNGVVPPASAPRGPAAGARARRKESSSRLVWRLFPKMLTCDFHVDRRLQSMWRAAWRNSGCMAPPVTPRAARPIYAGKGNCASCHRIKGVGSRIGPDLSEIGVRRPEQLTTKLINPDAGDQRRQSPLSRGAQERHAWSTDGC